MMVMMTIDINEDKEVGCGVDEDDKDDDDGYDGVDNGDDVQLNMR